MGPYKISMVHHMFLLKWLQSHSKNKLLLTYCLFDLAKLPFYCKCENQNNNMYLNHLFKKKETHPINIVLGKLVRPVSKQQQNFNIKDYSHS